LGGQLWLAAAPPHKDAITKLIRYLSGEMERLKVTVRVNCRATPALVAELRPDAVVLGTGALPLLPNVPGVELALTAWDVLSGKARAGDRVVVVGGADVGCETAEHLAALGKQVTILEMRAEVAAELMPWTRRMLVERLAAAGVEILIQTRLTKIEPSGVCYDRAGVAGKITPVDTVVLACGAASRRELPEQLPAGVPLHIVGDAKQPGNIADAIRSGFEAGYSL
jgi:pyruvate/2-oxoglutarate dehydrogenase complex dihydrolipoamide dehydrogenase (E3) component